MLLYDNHAYKVLSQSPVDASLPWQGCTITGSVVAADDQSRLVIQQENTVLPVQRHIGWPMEDGPFRFVPNPYTRKQ